MAAEEEAEELTATARDDTTLESLVRRREGGEPLAWITGSVRFCGHPVIAAPGVYVPRLQSEELAHRAATFLASTVRRRAVDLCTGAGAVAVHLLAAVPGAEVVGVDVDTEAAHCARSNGVPTVQADVDAPFRGGSFDVVTAVAPYVPTPELRFLPPDVRRHEPRRALDGGSDGLGVVRRVVRAAARLLSASGWLLLEVGGRQDDVLIPEIEIMGFSALTTWRDEDGDLRGLCARAPCPGRS